MVLSSTKYSFDFVDADVGVGVDVDVDADVGVGVGVGVGVDVDVDVDVGVVLLFLHAYCFVVNEYCQVPSLRGLHQLPGGLPMAPPSLATADRGWPRKIYNAGVVSCRCLFC